MGCRVSLLICSVSSCVMVVAFDVDSVVNVFAAAVVVVVVVVVPAFVLMILLLSLLMLLLLLVFSLLLLLWLMFGLSCCSIEFFLLVFLTLLLDS